VTYDPVEVPSLSIPPESKVQVEACFELDPLVFPQLPTYEPSAFTRSPRAHSPVKMPSQEQGIPRGRLAHSCQFPPEAPGAGWVAAFFARF
jgi:hypothetical protein